MLKPNGFFAQNAAMDLPADTNAHSVDNHGGPADGPKESASCCH
jgi:primary-amine oxidase